MLDLKIYPPLGPNVLADTRFSCQSMSTLLFKLSVNIVRAGLLNPKCFPKA